MKKYRLLEDLPTYNAGDKFYLDEQGNLCACDKQGTGFDKLIAYTKYTLDKFPTILTDWFEEVEEEWKPWRAEKGKKYYSIDGTDQHIYARTEHYSLYDGYTFRIGNYFSTQKKAERTLFKYIAYTTIKRDTKGFEPNWEDGEQEKWYVCYDSTDEEFCAYNTPWFQDLGQVYFESERDAKASLKEHRHEWELLFDLDEDN